MTLIKSISGIRGTIGGPPGDCLTPLDVVKFTSAYGQWLKNTGGAKDNLKVVIGRDARPSGESISQIVSATLQNLGIDVVDAGLSTTPTVEMGVVFENANGGIILTASHNPIQWNALKLLNENGEFISAEDGKAILDFADQQSFEYTSVENLGTYTLREEILEEHIQSILDLPLVDVDAISSRNFKIAIDAINSSGNIAIPALLESLGVETYTRITDSIDGIFAHNPEPLPAHLTDIINEVKNGDYDLGIVVDPDVDRLAFISEDGSYFGEEYTLVAIADYVLKNTPGNTVSNLSSSQALRIVTERHGGEYSASAVGEVNVVMKMKETDAVIGGEGNGGIIYPELHYGRDALVGVALFLSFLAKEELPASALRETYPSFVISKDKIQLSPSINVDEVLESVKTTFSNEEVDTTDGVKINFSADEKNRRNWVHLRKSNTEPIIRIYAESTSDSEAKKLTEYVKNEITKLTAI